MRRKATVGAGLLLAFLCLALGLGVSAQGEVARVEVRAIDSASFPFVEVRFRALDGAGRHVTGLSRSQVGIRDGETEATAEFIEEEDGPLMVHFVVEAGISLDPTSWTAAREIIQHFGRGGWMEGDQTQVAVSIVRGADIVPLIPFTSDANAIANMQNADNPGGGSTTTAPRALSNLLADMDRQSPGGAKAVVFLTRQLESNTGVETAIANSLQYGIPLYTFLLRSSERATSLPINGTPQPPPLDATVRRLAEETHGHYVVMAPQSFATDRDAAFDDLAARRRQYAIGYRVGDNLSGTRNVTISLPGDAGTVSGTGSYDFTIEAPRVLFRAPDTGDIITREGREGQTDPALAEPATQPVVATVGFPGNPERRVRRAVLMVDGLEADSIDNPPRGDGAEYLINLSWDMRGVTQEGETDHTLVVEITDELGLSDNDAAEIKVRLTMPEGVVVAPGGGGGVVPVLPTATPIPCLTPSPLCERVERPVRANPLAAISLLVALLALIFAAVIWATRGSAPVQRMTQTVRRGIDRLTNRYRRSEVRAYLEVLGGEDDIGKRYEIYGDTPIGRSRQNAELLFQQEVENSPISRLHCTITDEEDHFMLRDEDSANGTYLNGERLTPIVPYRLKDGDIVELARVERGGVRLRFVAATPEDTLPPDGHYTGADGQQPPAVTQVNPQERF